MTLLVDTQLEIPFDFDYSIMAQNAVEKVLDHEGFSYEAQISLTLTDEDEIHRINHEFRQIDKPTDVLSFPMLDFETPGVIPDEGMLDDCIDPDSGEVVLGDIVICVPRVIAQAAEYGHSELREYVFLIVHSVLHLLGYDHMTDEDRSIMEKKQDEIMNELDIQR